MVPPVVWSSAPLNRLGAEASVSRVCITDAMNLELFVVVVAVFVLANIKLRLFSLV